MEIGIGTLGLRRYLGESYTAGHAANGAGYGAKRQWPILNEKGVEHLGTIKFG